MVLTENPFGSSIKRLLQAVKNSAALFCSPFLSETSKYIYQNKMESSLLSVKMAGMVKAVFL